MEHKEQQAPLPEQRKAAQQAYSSWQYDNDDQGDQLGLEPLPSIALPRLLLPHLSRQLRQSSQASKYSDRDQLPRPPAADYQPVQDMGTSLGYGQGMAHPYFDAPQPSQPIAQLRQDRLQQLREERLQYQAQPIDQEANLSFLTWSNGAGGSQNVLYPEFPSLNNR